jgi:hypothetical protein
MQGTENVVEGPPGGNPPRPNEGRDCRKEFARGFYLWIVAAVTYPVWGFFAAVGMGHLGNRITGRSDELPNVWSIATLFVGFLVVAAVRYTRRCPACKKRIPVTDFRPMRCGCGVLLNDKHRNGPWW